MVTLTGLLSLEAASRSVELAEGDPARVALADAVLSYVADCDEPPPNGLLERTLARCTIDAFDSGRDV